MSKTGKVLIFSLLSLALLSGQADGYDSCQPLRVTKVELCRDKPRGLGIFDLRDNSEFKEGEDEVYIYIELANCKYKKEGRFYNIDLTVDVAIYYEDGICVFSEEEASTFDYQTPRNTDRGYLWLKIESVYLKEGEYKVEMKIRDNNSGKESFAMARFVRL